MDWEPPRRKIIRGVGIAMVFVMGAGLWWLIAVGVISDDHDNHDGPGGRLSCSHDNSDCVATFDRKVNDAEVIFHGKPIQLTAVEGDLATLKQYGATIRLHNGKSGYMGEDEGDDPGILLEVLKISPEEVAVKLHEPTMSSIFHL